MYVIYTKKRGVSERRVPKIQLIMRLTTIILIATIMQVNASSFAQRISLNVKNARLNVIMKEISKQTGYEFFYDANLIKNTKPVSIKILNATIDDALELCFTGQSITYKIENKVVSLKPLTKSIIDKIGTAVSAVFTDIDIKGRVVDEKENPLIGATVKILNTTKVVLTDKNGGFLFHNVDENALLLISYIGYQSKKVLVKNSLPIVIKLQEAGDLDEIQIIGYGETTRKLNTGSVSTISAKQIEQQPVTNILSALSGRMPGVFVQTTNGLPGGNINIQIRGKGSIAAGTNPLYVVDGVPYDGGSINSGTNLGERNIAGAISPLNNLIPADIESITVLKDADATSIYGSRGTNGVVLITTKKNSSGKTKLELTIQQGISNIASRPNLLNLADYLEIRREAFINDKRTPSSDPTSSDYAPELTVWSQIQGTDWVDYLFGGTAKSSDLHANVTGSQGSTSFAIAGSYRFENSILPGPNRYTRVGLTSRIQHHSTNDKFKISLSNQFGFQANDLVNPTNTISSAYLLAPNYPLLLENGQYNWRSNNILADLNAKSTSRIENSLTSLSSSYELIEGLSIKANAGYTRTVYDQTLLFPTNALYPGTINSSNFGKNSGRSIIIEPLIDYKLKVNQSTFNILAGATYQHRTSDLLYLEASNFKLEGQMQDLGSAGSIDLRATTYNEYKYISAFGRVTYNLLDTYILNATIRRDGSSRFGSGNRFGNFGSVGVAWLFSNLQFLKEKMPFLSFGKLRGSYGTTGNDQISDYQFKSTYSSPGTSLYQDVASIRPSRINNYNFKWETTRKLDIALELGLLNDRFQINVDYYRNRSTDQLIRYAIPQITGFANFQANLPAIIENKGWELSVQAKVLERGKLNWQSSLNVTLPQNRLKSFKNFSTSSYATTYELGYDISRLYGYRQLGIDQSTGKMQYSSQDGAASISPYFYFTLGKVTPDFYGGLDNTFNYCNFDLNFFAQFVSQQSRGGLVQTPGSSAQNNFSLVKERWTTSNTSSLIPRAATSNDFNFQNSAANIFDTSYFRLKTLAVGYRLGQATLEKIRLNSLRVFVNVQNIFTLWDSNAAVLDPESGALSSTYGKNIPALRTYSFGLQINL